MDEHEPRRIDASGISKIHSKYKTPSFATLITGLVVGVPILFTNKTFVLDFTSIATLFAFVLVCGGVLLLPRVEKKEKVVLVCLISMEKLYFRHL